MSEVLESFRWINLALGAVLSVAMLARWGAFLRAPVASKYGRLAVFAWVTSTLFGTVEVLHQGLPAGPRVPTVTSVLALTAVWCYQERAYDRRERARLAARAATSASPRRGSEPLTSPAR